MRLYVRTKYNNLGTISAIVLDSNDNVLFICDAIDMRGVIKTIRMWLKFEYENPKSVQLTHLSKSY